MEKKLLPLLDVAWPSSFSFSSSFTSFTSSSSLDFLTAFPLRVGSSWSNAWLDYETRLAMGLQPNLPGVDGWTILGGCLVYLLGCAILAAWMAKRKTGMRIKALLIAYNVVCIVLAGYVVVGILLFKLETPGTFACNPLVTSKRGQQLAFVFWVFYAQKYVELLDTWFYILRKSFRQVTFLHLFHHVSIIVVVGTIIRFDFSGDMYLPVLLNATVHILLYLHYLLTACGIKSWWRPYLTTIQIGQFVLICSQSLLAYAQGPSCGTPDFAKVMLVCYMGSMIILFLNFFFARYVLSRATASMAGVIKSVSEKIPDSFTGHVQLNQSGGAMITLPLKIPPAVRDFEYQLTPIDCAMPHIHVARGIYVNSHQLGTFVISGGESNAHVSWQVRVVSKHEEDSQHTKTQ